MANDYKRMWTKEEVKSNSVVDLPDIPDVIDANSPDIIRVQGKLYYKKEIDQNQVTDLTGTKWHFKENIDLTGVDIDYAYINYISNNGVEYDIFAAYDNVNRITYVTDDFFEHVYENNEWKKQTYRTIEITGGEKVKSAELIDFLIHNANLLTAYSYEEVGGSIDTSSTPTDVSIIEDQGKLELMLEHDGNVLAINDTPNQFLQRRLDKPSATYQLPVNNTNKYYIPEDILETIKLNSVVSLSFMDNSTATDITVYGIVNAKSGKYMSLQTCCVSSNYSDEMLLVYNISFFDNISLQGINVSTNNLNSTFDLDTTTPSVTLKIF